ncbi:hypothetical protein AX774_g7084 [Zancudomyces culisetae]|uniref:Uncharacterized protein n=1 Tax=Zancudomyces culisetae TaxID=1213189 RepID=A0A1R1PET6_ZANCU|nr:hypothetical protein AX774_g7084 [Zancudomyces culisetae]|eukprot:OMH79505.1 hypothetical protein AX774_g7084 [Zancudomyces culisetae]
MKKTIPTTQATQSSEREEYEKYHRGLIGDTRANKVKNSEAYKGGESDLLKLDNSRLCSEKESARNDNVNAYKGTEKRMENMEEHEDMFFPVNFSNNCAHSVTKPGPCNDIDNSTDDLKGVKSCSDKLKNKESEDKTTSNKMDAKKGILSSSTQPKKLGNERQGYVKAPKCRIKRSRSIQIPIEDCRFTMLNKYTRSRYNKGETGTVGNDMSSIVNLNKEKKYFRDVEEFNQVKDIKLTQDQAVQDLRRENRVIVRQLKKLFKRQQQTEFRGNSDGGSKNLPSLFRHEKDTGKRNVLDLKVQTTTSLNLSSGSDLGPSLGTSAKILPNFDNMSYTKNDGYTEDVITTVRSIFENREKATHGFSKDGDERYFSNGFGIRRVNSTSIRNIILKDIQEGTGNIIKCSTKESRGKYYRKQSSGEEGLANKRKSTCGGRISVVNDIDEKRNKKETDHKTYEYNGKKTQGKENGYNMQYKNIEDGQGESDKEGDKKVGSVIGIDSGTENEGGGEIAIESDSDSESESESESDNSLIVLSPLDKLVMQMMLEYKSTNSPTTLNASGTNLASLPNVHENVNTTSSADVDIDICDLLENGLYKPNIYEIKDTNTINEIFSAHTDKQSEQKINKEEMGVARVEVEDERGGIPNKSKFDDTSTINTLIVPEPANNNKDSNLSGTKNGGYSSFGGLGRFGGKKNKKKEKEEGVEGSKAEGSKRFFDKLVKQYYSSSFYNYGITEKIKSKFFTKPNVTGDNKKNEGQVETQICESESESERCKQMNKSNRNSASTCVFEPLELQILAENNRSSELDSKNNTSNYVNNDEMVEDIGGGRIADGFELDFGNIEQIRKVENQHIKGLRELFANSEHTKPTKPSKPQGIDTWRSADELYLPPPIQILSPTKLVGNPTFQININKSGINSASTLTDGSSDNFGDDQRKFDIKSIQKCNYIPSALPYQTYYELDGEHRGNDSVEEFIYNQTIQETKIKENSLGSNNEKGKRNGFPELLESGYNTNINKAKRTASTKRFYTHHH